MLFKNLIKSKCFFAILSFCIISLFLFFVCGKFSSKETTENIGLKGGMKYHTNVIPQDLLSIDEKYYKEKKQATSNAELTNLNEKYSNIWKEKIDFYYEKIKCSFSYEEIHAKNEVDSLKESWNEYYKNEITSTNKVLASIYGSGSIVPVVLSEYDMLLCRNKAIELSLIRIQGDGSAIDELN